MNETIRRHWELKRHLDTIPENDERYAKYRALVIAEMEKPIGDRIDKPMELIKDLSQIKD